MYDPRFSSGPNHPFPELDDLTFWSEVASQVDTTTLLHPDTPAPIPPYRVTESLRLPTPQITTAITPYQTRTERGLPGTPGLAEQLPSQTKKQSSLLLPFCLIGLACIAIFAVLGTQHTTHTSSSSTPPVQSGTDYRAMARTDALAVGIPPDLFVRQINQESGFDPKAVSSAGAVGIAQFLPSTAAGLGIDPWNPMQALKGAAKLMANFFHHYGDYAKALAAYNCGSGCVAQAIALGGSRWGCYVPAETSGYIAAIMAITICP